MWCRTARQGPGSASAWGFGRMSDPANTHIRPYAHTHIRTYARTHVRTYARTHIRTYAHTHIRTYAHTNVRTYADTHIRTYAHTYISTHGLLIEATLHRHLPRCGGEGVSILGVGARFLRTGCTVLWQLSQNPVRSEFTIPRPFPCAVHGGTVAAPVAGNKYRQVAEKGELSMKTRYSCSTLTLVRFAREGRRHLSPLSAQ